MKRKMLQLTYMVAVMLFTFLSGKTAFATEASVVYVTENTEAAQSTETVEEEKTEYVIRKKKGKTYCYDASGKKVKKQWVTVKGKTYYFDKTGNMKKGWMKQKGKYYYFDRNTGKQKFNCKVDGIRLKKDGTAVKSTYNDSKIETMITARNIMLSNTKVSDTKSQKLKKCFMWVMKHSYHRYRTIRQARVNKGWEMTFANDIYQKGNGCCVSEACAFAFLAHECGYKDVYVCDDTGHAWTEINGKVYDTLFAEAKHGASYAHPDFAHYYNASYKAAGLYHGPLMGHKKI